MGDLRTMTLGEAEAFAVDTLRQPRFRGEQMWRWAHQKRVRDLNGMGNLPTSLREQLAASTSLGGVALDMVQRSSDGTRKMRLRTRDNRFIESVLIPEGDKLTQCISSQVGCALGCAFCATAKMGFVRHLDAGEIVDQVYHGIEVLKQDGEGQRVTNLVYMGMGEPLHNFAAVAKSLEILTTEIGANLSNRRITVSTVGLVPGIEKLGALPKRPNLAVSLNAPNDDIRSQIMPVNQRFPIAELMQALRDYPLERRRRITFEYVMLAGLNDQIEHAQQLARLVRGIPCKINVIPWNPHPQAPYKRPTPEAIEAFQDVLRQKRVAVFMRRPRGDDIDAACGQLANRGAVSSRSESEDVGQDSETISEG